MFDNTMSTAYKLGSYQAIAQMMRREIRKLDTAEDQFDRDWALRNLHDLADQLDSTEEKFKKGVDTV